jgi:hypothetical protein
MPGRTRIFYGPPNYWISFIIDLTWKVNVLTETGSFKIVEMGKLVNPGLDRIIAFEGVHTTDVSKNIRINHIFFFHYCLQEKELQARKNQLLINQETFSVRYEKKRKK